MSAETEVFKIVSGINLPGKTKKATTYLAFPDANSLGKHTEFAVVLTGSNEPMDITLSDRAGKLVTSVIEVQLYNREYAPCRKLSEEVISRIEDEFPSAYRGDDFSLIQVGQTVWNVIVLTFDIEN